MKNLLKGTLAVAVALTALSARSNAQTVAVNGVGSSALFVELGLAASAPNTGSNPGLGASCVWSENTNTVIATDTTAGTLQDKGNAFVAWTPGSGSCAMPVSPTIYAYLQTDSVVGNRCLFNGTGCTIAYPTNTPASAGLILGGSNEVGLPVSIANAINGTAVNTAGTDIRPEDAEFAVARALAPCGAPVATGSQYLGLGYTNGSTIGSHFSGSLFNVINFSLPSAFAVTPVGATPIVVTVNGDGTSNGFSNTNITNLSSSVLAGFLDGTNSYTGQALPSPSATGAAATVILREPLSGTYNTMEYNDPNTVALQTSQDVGVNQPSGQVNCSGTSPLSNPLNIATPSGGARQRAIGTGQELSEVIATQNSLGYGFWSVANFKGFTNAAAPNAKYLTIDNIEPLLNPAYSHTGTIPVTGSTDLAHVDLTNVSNGSYPLWSLLRLVNTGSTPSAAVASLAAAAQNFVTTGSSTSTPDFAIPSSLTVVRSHFLPPAGSGEPATAANGHVGNIARSACTATEAGGDVGGQVINLTDDSNYCSTNGVTTGQTGLRR